MDLKEHSIRQYISNIDFKNDDWKVSKIQEDMRRLLGEEPGIDIVYKKDVVLQEYKYDQHGKETYSYGAPVKKEGEE